MTLSLYKFTNKYSMLKNNQRKSIIITTINKPNKVINKYLDLAKKNKAEYIIIADKKTPLYKKNFPLVNLQEQKKLGFSITRSLPYNSYSRKNIGYLLAMRNNSKIIIETDDDNYPKNNFFNNLECNKALKELSGPKWINILKVFSKKKLLIWPRGFPLSFVNQNAKIKIKKKNVYSPIQQRMCDGNPDVDAIYRLTNKFKNHTFKDDNFSINHNSFCPFNSQNTVWHEVAFPLMYLPSYCTMRATDIWRAFVAIRILKNYKWNLSFLKSTVIQVRNTHDLQDDFNQEISVYKNTINFNKVLTNLKLSTKYDDMLINIYKCYCKLIENKILEKKELSILNKWLSDVRKIYPNFKKVNI